MATEKRLLDANDVKELINGLSELPWEEEVDYLVDGLPTVDAVEVVHGRWENGRCINCGQVDFSKPKYCPNCGAKMDGERKDNE